MEKKKRFVDLSSNSPTDATYGCVVSQARCPFLWEPCPGKRSALLQRAEYVPCLMHRFHHAPTPKGSENLVCGTSLRWTLVLQQPSMKSRSSQCRTMWEISVAAVDVVAVGLVVVVLVVTVAVVGVVAVVVGHQGSSVPQEFANHKVSQGSTRDSQQQ